MTEVDHPGNFRPWFRRRWFRGLLLLLAFPLLLFFLSNAWLSLPGGRDWVAKKISSRLGLEARVSGTTWSPWNGVRVSGIVLEQPVSLRDGIAEPLFTAESVRVWPVWRACLEKRIEVHSIELNSPRAVVPVQLISQLAGPPKLIVAPPPAPAVAVTPPVAIPPVSQAPREVKPPSPPPIMAAPVPPPAIPAPPSPTGWIHVHEGSLAIVSSHQPLPLFEASGFNSDIPAAGDPAQSIAHLGTIRLFQNEMASQLDIPLRWENPILQLGPIAGQFQGVPYRLAARLSHFGNVPIDIQFDVPLKADTTLTLPGGGIAKAKELRAAGRFIGLMTSPSSWQADLIAEGIDLSASLPPRPELKFDRGSAVVVLRGGVLSCTDARLIGDDLSLLGNATVLSDSRGAAVLRIVAGQEMAQNLSNSIGRTTGKRTVFGTLGTPDRYASDLYALGNLDGVHVQLGQGGDVIDGPTLLSLLKAMPRASQ